jgi:Uma2 family endonuclease
MPLTAKTYASVALEDPEGQWELHRGRLWEKPPMTAFHHHEAYELSFAIRRQVNPSEFVVRANSARLRRTDETFYIPDVVVVTTRLVDRLLNRSDVLESYEEPLPFVAEVWSPSTGDYDVDTKIPEYKRRGDLEIWRLHPYERSRIAWRQPDGTYAESRFERGQVQLWALPSVTILPIRRRECAEPFPRPDCTEEYREGNRSDPVGTGIGAPVGPPRPRAVPSRSRRSPVARALVPRARSV